jgi:hypothetical protein
MMNSLRTSSHSRVALPAMASLVITLSLHWESLSFVRLLRKDSDGNSEVQSCLPFEYSYIIELVFLPAISCRVSEYSCLGDA